MTTKEAPKLNELENGLVIRTQWDLSPLLTDGVDDKLFFSERESIEVNTTKFVDKWMGVVDLTDPTLLLTALDDYESWARSHGNRGNGGYYFDLQMNLDQNNPALKADQKRINEFGRKIWDRMRFFTHRVSHIPPEEREKILSFEGLSKYKHYLERKWEREKYLLSEQEEKIVGIKAAPSHGNWVRMLAGFISAAEREVLQEDGSRKSRVFSDLYEGLINSQNKPVRDEAARAINDIFASFADVAEWELNSVLENHKGNDELRGYPRPDTSRHVADDIDSQVVDTLLDVVARNFDIVHRYYRLKSALLGLPSLEYHERNLEVSENDRNVPFSEAASLVHDVLSKLDPEFGHIFKALLSNGQVDVFPSKGKRGGNYVIHDRIPVPMFMSLNYTGKSRDIRTLAHESGHAVNTELMRNRQNELNFGTSKATAEVSSTFMEDFVFQRLLADASDEQRLILLMGKLNDDVITIFRQVAIYRFEQELHHQFRDKGYLSKQEIGEIYKRHMVSYMGESVEQSPGSENWWIPIEHIRRFFITTKISKGRPRIYR